MIRDALRAWVHLPHDVPIAYFHSDIADGGLGIPSLRWTLPLRKRNRLLNLKIPTLDDNASA